jgi:hypothetical protein
MEHMPESKICGPASAPFISAPPAGDTVKEGFPKSVASLVEEVVAKE